MTKGRVSLSLVVLVFFLWGWTGVGGGQPVLQASPFWVKPGEKILLKFSGAPENEYDWIAIYHVGEKDEKYYQEWHYLSKETCGELTFTAPKKEGDYEFSLFGSRPEGGYEAIATSNVIRVGVSAPPMLYDGAFRLSTGELIIGELLSFDGNIFKIKTERGVIKKRRGDIVGILIGAKRLAPITSLSQWAAKARGSSQYSSSEWSAEQATGEPNTFKCGGIETAWAPESNGSDPEWLKLTFDTPVYATKLRVHETYNAGFIYEVEFVDIYGEKHTVWQGEDATPCPGWFEINLEQTPYIVESVILCTEIKGYEEIDAVQLIGVLISE